MSGFVGGGGLGSVINTGIRQDDMAAILGGTGVLMLMALVLDSCADMAMAMTVANIENTVMIRPLRHPLNAQYVRTARAAQDNIFIIYTVASCLLFYMYFPQ